MFARRGAQDYPQRVAIQMADGGSSLTYAAYEANANRLAHHFRDLGLRRGDHVAIFMENNLRAFECEGAAERTGLYYTLVNSHLSVEETAFIVNDCGAQVVLTTVAMMPTASKLPPHCPGVREWLVADAPRGASLPGFAVMDDVLAGTSADPVADEEAGTAMFYSSGTTGRPKGIVRQLPEIALDADGPVTRLATNWGFRPGQIYLSPAPIYHSAPTASISATLRLGGTAIIMGRFDARRYLELVQQHRVTTSQVVPTMFVRMLKLPQELRASFDVSSLESVVHAAAPCPPDIKRAMIDWWGPIITEHAGSTEGVGTCIATSEQWLSHPGSVGRPVSGKAVALDGEGKVLPAGEQGQLWYTNSPRFRYAGDDAKTKAAIDSERGLATVGDIGYVDGDGFVYLTDRAGFMIISGGVNISPTEVEGLLVTHPDVLDAAVVGVPDEDLGEVVKAVVQLMPGAEPGPALERRLIDYCQVSLARFKTPRSVDFVDELPRLAVSKLNKRELLERYRQGARP